MENAESREKILNALSLLNHKGTRSVIEMRQLIMGLEAVMKSMPEFLGPDDFKTTHHFESGVYVRELFIPKGIVLTGRIHKTAHLNILSQGQITVWTEEGMKTLSASTVIKSMPGIKRVGYAHEDSVWMTVHHNVTNERELKKVEARLFADDFDQAYLSSQRTIEDVAAFLGITLEQMSEISENESDQIPFEVDSSLVRVRPSPIHGHGVFALKMIEPETFIAHARIQGKRTPVGRYCNHSGTPNVDMVMRGNGDVVLISRKRIAPNKEVLNDYYISYVNTRLKGGVWERERLCQP